MAFQKVSGQNDYADENGRSINLERIYDVMTSQSGGVLGASHLGLRRRNGPEILNTDLYDLLDEAIDSTFSGQGRNWIDQSGDSITDPLRGYYVDTQTDKNSSNDALGYIAKAGADIIEGVAKVGAAVWEAAAAPFKALGGALDKYNTNYKQGQIDKYAKLGVDIEDHLSGQALENYKKYGASALDNGDLEKARDEAKSADAYANLARRAAENSETIITREQYNNGDYNGDGKTNFRDVGASLRNAGRGIKEGIQKIGQGLKNAWDKVKSWFSKEKPLVIDLDGDGLELIGAHLGAEFDWDNDGFMEATGWVDQDDAILVIDLDADGTIGQGDGQIDQVNELSLASWHADAETDFEGLKLAFDSNDDGVFDASDEHFGAFRVWQDKDGDAEVDEGELKTLDEAEILSVDVSDLGYQDAQAIADDKDFAAALIKELASNHLHGATTLTKTDGSKLNVGDITAINDNLKCAPYERKDVA